MSLSHSPFGHRAVLFCSAVAALAIATIAPLRSVALSQITRTLHSSSVPGIHQLPRAMAHLRHRSHTGYWHTEGSRIVTANHATVRIAGVNWSGLETPAGMPGGLDRQDYHSILRLIADSGYNTIRIPFSNQMVEDPAVPAAIRFENANGAINADLEGLNSLQILDHIIFAAGELGLRVILDDHRSEAGSSAEQNGLWYTDEYPEENWIADWVTLAARYKNIPTVVGVDLRNEPHNASSGGACWDCTGARDWHLAAQRAGDAVLHTNPNLLVFVEGVDSYDGDSSWWGGNLAGVRRSPIHLSLPNRLVYSAHVYGPAEYQQPWFNRNTTPDSLVAKLRHDWAFISESGLAPVWIGEFGTPNTDEAVASTDPGSEGQWFQTLVTYLGQHPQVGWTYWGLNGEDRYGLLDASYTAAASPLKSNALSTILQTPSTSIAVAGLRTSMSQSPLQNTAASRQADTLGYAPSAAQPSITVPPTPVSVVYTPPSLAYSSFAQHDKESSHPGGALQHSARTSDALAEQVRIATQQALNSLPPSE